MQIFSLFVLLSSVRGVEASFPNKFCWWGIGNYWSKEVSYELQWLLRSWFFVKQCSAITRRKTGLVLAHHQLSFSSLILASQSVGVITSNLLSILYWEWNVAYELVQMPDCHFCHVIGCKRLHLFCNLLMAKDTFMISERRRRLSAFVMRRKCVCCLVYVYLWVVFYF